MYLTWSKKIITDFSEKNINSLYNEGYLFMRTGKGEMYQTRGVRIDLSKFELSSENRRILKKTEGIGLRTYDLPHAGYTWEIGKLGKDFYDTKFGKNIFSANKVKELLTIKHNFNKLFIYKNAECEIGYSICYENKEILHYCYPFYNLQSEIKNLGLGMMLKAIIYAQEHQKHYIYLGSAQRPADVYKLQFEGLEWFDGKKWKQNLEELKNILK